MGPQRQTLFHYFIPFFFSLSFPPVRWRHWFCLYVTLRCLYVILTSAEIKYSYLFEADDALLGVPICRYGERVGALWVNDAVLDVCVDAQVFVVSFDLPHWFAYLGRFRDVELVVFCRYTFICKQGQPQQGKWYKQKLISAMCYFNSAWTNSAWFRHY